MIFFNPKQFVDSQACLDCKGCCRFKGEKSLWRPKLMKQEADYISEETVDEESRIKSVISGNQYICTFLDEKTSMCRKYVERPFECLLYPFVLVKEKDSVCVAAHLACPFIQEKKDSDAFLKYCQELKDFFVSIEDKIEVKTLAQSYPNADQELDILFSI